MSRLVVAGQALSDLWRDRGVVVLLDKLFELAAVFTGQMLSICGNQGEQGLVPHYRELVFASERSLGVWLVVHAVIFIEDLALVFTEAHEEFDHRSDHLSR